MMLLPSKNEVRDSKNADRKREIDEGVKLATKVDTLRQAAATEESRLRTFREAALAVTKKQIAEATEELNSLKVEVARLEMWKLKAKEPLDGQWKHLKEQQFQFDVERKEHTAEYAKQAKWQLELTEKDVALQKKETALEERETDAETLVLEAQNILASAKESSRRMISEAQKSSEAALALESSVNHREDHVLRRESESDRREENQEIRDREQDDRDRAINDRYQTLLKAVEEYGTKRPPRRK